MAVKRISINWVAKLNDSKDLPKYGDSARTSPPSLPCPRYLNRGGMK